MSPYITLYSEFTIIIVPICKKGITISTSAQFIRMIIQDRIDMMQSLLSKIGEKVTHSICLSSVHQTEQGAICTE